MSMKSERLKLPVPNAFSLTLLHNSTIESIFLSFMNLTSTNFLSQTVERVNKDISLLLFSISHSSMHSEFGTCRSTASEIFVGSALRQKKPGTSQVSFPAPTSCYLSSHFASPSAAKPWKEFMHLPNTPIQG